MAKKTKKKKTTKKKAAGKRGNPNPSPATRFKKGNTASKGFGRPKLTEEQKALRLTTRTQFRNLVAEYSTLNLEEVKELLNEAKLPVIDMAVLKHLEIMLTTGERDRVDWTMNHMVGKPKEEKNINLVSHNMNIDLKKMNKEQLTKYRELMAEVNGDEE